MYVSARRWINDNAFFVSHGWKEDTTLEEVNSNYIVNGIPNTRGCDIGFATAGSIKKICNADRYRHMRVCTFVHKRLEFREKHDHVYVHVMHV